MNPIDRKLFPHLVIHPLMPRPQREGFVFLLNPWSIITISIVGTLNAREVTSKELSSELNEIISTIFSLDSLLDDSENFELKLLNMITENGKKKIPSC